MSDRAVEIKKCVIEEDNRVKMLETFFFSSSNFCQGGAASELRMEISQCSHPLGKEKEGAGD